MLLHKTLGTDALGHPILPVADAAADAAAEAQLVGDADADAAAAAAVDAAADADAAAEGAAVLTPLQEVLAAVRTEERVAMARGALQRAVQKTSMHPERPTR